MLIRTRPILSWLALAALMFLTSAREVSAAAEIHRLSVVLSSIPTQIAGGDFNESLDFFNRTRLRPRGLEALDEVTFAWLHTAELRYFVRPNLAVSLGVGQLRSQTSREFLPAIQQSVQLRAEVLSVPVYAGGAYYLAPYTQGDFQARAYLGGGFVSNVYTRSVFEQVESNTDSLTTLGGDFRQDATRDGPGYYVEVGAHLFFALRYSVMLSAVYRGAEIRRLLDQRTNQPVLTPDGRPFTLDLSGLGGRMGIAIGF
ncbi:MAG TPA: hypothetical protein VEY91_07855 [Candidatus Limnocylindria bacterium]|nr:hypothetical protein [Candidatus Limnocylindria bacterium]